MLKKLLVKNYAIIEEINIDFTQGLNIITGETGAGKSILLGALGLIMGNRAESKTLFNKEKKCIIEGVFTIEQSFHSFFKEQDIDFEKETIIRREITPSGKSRAFINDTPTTLSNLKVLTSALVDLHQQFDTLDIHNISFQLNIIDALAKHKNEVEDYRNQYRAYSLKKKKLQDLINKNQEASKENDFLAFQLKELEEASLISNEDEDAENELKSLSHAEDIQRVLGNVHQQLTENEISLQSQLKDLSYELNNIIKFNSKIENIQDKLDSITLDLEDLSDEIQSIAENTELDPERISEIRERLDIIYRLQNKHQVQSVDDLLAIQSNISNQLNTFDNLSNDILQLSNEIAEDKKKLTQIAQKTSKNRKLIIPHFEAKIKELLYQLSMPFAQLKVEINQSEELSINGLDQVEFLFAANKGSQLESIKDVASGGELSRLTLCVKSLIADALELPTMIFDEIDSGVSGDVALKMGQIIKNLAIEHQIITITHTPQIAVQADRHFYIYKNHEGDKTSTSIKTLDKKERINEIAIMLSGSPPSSNAIKNAKELIG